MGSVIGTVLAGVGVTVATASLLALVHVSGLTGAPRAPGLLLLAIAVFLLGVFVFGYGVGRRTGY